MLNLSKTVERILKIEPTLEEKLLPIKTKWEKTHRNELYWGQLMKVLNTEIPPVHPKRMLIQNLFIPRKSPPKKPYTFEAPSSIETIVGTIPEFMDSRFRKYDRLQVEFAKKTIEARMTHNEALMVDTQKKLEKLEVDQRKLWWDLKNYFNLWKVENPTSFFIRSKGPLLVLTSIKIGPPSGGGGPGPNMPEGGPDNYMIRMDPETLRKLFKFLNITPPGSTPESE